MPPAPAIPVDVADVTPEWISAVTQFDVVAVDVLDAHSGTTGRARLALTYGGGEDEFLPASVFVKLPPFDERQREFVARTGLGTAEARFYRDLAESVPVRIPGVLHADVDDDGRYVMLLEDLEASGCRFPRPTDDDVVSVVDSIVCELAHLHACFWEHADLTARHDWVSQGMRIAFGSGGRFMKMALDQFAADMPPAYRALGELYIDRARDIAELWAAPPHTLAHGDPHMGNLFVDDGRAGFFDWGMLMAKNGMWDVAYVICNSVPTDVRRAHERGWLDLYRAELATAGIALDGDRVWAQYRLYAVYSWNSAVSTAAMGGRWQPEARAHGAMLRTTTAIEDLDSVGLLEELLA
ncbi:MAG TPA: phosphotransferase [Acidimicrobiia bacterium]|nr:phosphotransferase [Acidimicrobiia bacterium]